MSTEPDQVWREVPDVGALKHRIEELLADNDSMRLDLWAKDVAIRVLAERINEMEQEVP